MTPPNPTGEQMGETVQQKCERLRREMHEAPLNKVFQDHNGHRHLGTHSTAWARKSREWCDAMAELAASTSQQGEQQ